MINKMRSVPLLSPYDRFVRLFIRWIPMGLKPNYLTFARLALTPLLIVILVFENYGVGLIFFICLALTDMLDGALARIRNQITDWGKIWDPVADKTLIGSVVAVLLLKINLSLTIFLLAFEMAFILGGAFQRMKIKDIEIKANTWGKIKMNLHCLGGALLILGFGLESGIMISVAELAFYFSLFFAVASMLTKGL